MSVVGSRKTLSALALGVLIALAFAVVVTVQSKSAASAGTATVGSHFAALEPASQEMLAELPAETKTRLNLMSMRIGGSTGGEKDLVSALGEAKRPDGRTVRVAAVGGSICAFIDRGVGTCGELDLAEAGQLFSASPIGCDGYRVLGVVPDGVASMEIDSRADGEIDAALPVESNVYLGVLDPVETIATGVNRAGEPIFEVELPLAGYRAMDEA